MVFRLLCDVSCTFRCAVCGSLFAYASIVQIHHKCQTIFNNSNKPAPEWCWLKSCCHSFENMKRYLLIWCDNIMGAILWTRTHHVLGSKQRISYWLTSSIWNVCGFQQINFTWCTVCLLDFSAEPNAICLILLLFRTIIDQNACLHKLKSLFVRWMYHVRFMLCEDKETKGKSHAIFDRFWNC